jgi:hypothetical protein
MKKLFLALVIGASFSASAGEIDYTIEQSKCVSSCKVYTYSFQSIFRGKCEQIDLCDTLVWNEEQNACEVIAKNEKRTYIIECRNIPAAL